jgi:hypothetical protein
LALRKGKISYAQKLWITLWTDDLNTQRKADSGGLSGYMLKKYTSQNPNKNNAMP